MRDTRRWRNLVAQDQEREQHAFGVDETAPHLGRGQNPVQIVFSVWATLSEHKWVTLA